MNTMKRLSIIMISIFALASCSSPFLINTKGYASHGLGWDLDKAWEGTAQFKYIPDWGNYYASPKEFENAGGGDCEDFCIYLMYLTGHGELICCADLIEYGENHFLVYIDGRYIDPQLYLRSYEYSELKIVSRTSWYDTMLISTMGGMKTIQ